MSHDELSTIILALVSKVITLRLYVSSLISSLLEKSSLSLCRQWNICFMIVCILTVYQSIYLGIYSRMYILSVRFHKLSCDTQVIDRESVCMNRLQRRIFKQATKIVFAYDFFW